jgi:hypothetical protein
MHSTKAKSLFRSSLIAAIFYMGILLLLGINFAETDTMWSDRAWASERIQAAKTIEQLLPVCQTAVGRLSDSQQLKDVMFGAVWLTSFAFCLFLCVNAFRIRRLERQLPKDEPQN